MIGEDTRAWQVHLERLRFTLALLEGASRRGDLRLLNAALKRNDGQLLALRRRRHPEARSPRVALHYAASVVLQERMLRELDE